MTSNPLLGAAVNGLTLYDGWKNPRVLATPNININGGWTDSVQVTPDGSRLFFAYTKLDFSKFFYSGGQVQEYTGPTRPGMIGDKFKIFTAHIGSGVVSYHPANPDNPNIHISSPGINPQRDLMLMSFWDDADGPDSQLAVSKRTGEVWSEPSLICINSFKEDDNASVIGTQNEFLMHFASSRENLSGQNRIWQTLYQNGGFSLPVITPGLSIEGSLDDQPSLSPDATKIFWTSVRNNSYGIYLGDINSNGVVSNTRPVILLNLVPPFIGKTIMIGEFTIAEFPTKYLGYFVAGICNGVDSDGLPNSVQLKICVTSKSK